jgi:CHAD domain-containing protein
MARPRPVVGIDPSRRVRPNARRILATRIEEIYQYDGLVGDPANVTELHDMRIAFKRLRYLIEIFGPAFSADLDPFLEQAKSMQDLLGDIHDCDVQIPMLEAHLAWLEQQETDSVARMLGGARRARTPDDPEIALARFRSRLDAARRTDERPGIHTLIAIRRAQRVTLYRQFTDEWRRLKHARFRQRLERSLGID